MVNSLNQFGERFGDLELTNLLSLSLYPCESLVSLSEQFGELKNLKDLNLQYCTSLKR